MRESTSTMVSVVVPIYNVSEYLVDCLESIKNQRHHNLEVILIDDGSTDDSGTICDTYASQDSRFRVIHQANAGLSAARNAGTAIASAPWLIYIDSDDIVSENYISDLLDAVISNNADSAACRFTLVNEKDHHLSSEQARQSLMIVPPEMAVCELLSEKKASTSAWGKLAKTSLWLHNPFPEERASIMPVQKAWPVEDVINLIREYDFTGQRRVSFEYTMFAGLNDTKRHADALIRLLKGLECRVNLIRFHKIPDAPYETSPQI